MTYDIMHFMNGAALGLVEHRRRIAPLHRPVGGAWSGAIRHRAWTFDYCGWEGMQVMVKSAGAWRAHFRRPAGTWHLYAPGVEYRERQDRPELQREDMWFHFTLRRSNRFFPKGMFAEFADAEEVIAPRVRTLYALQQRGEPGGELVAHGLFLSILGEIVAASRRGGDGSPARPWRVRSPEFAGAQKGESLHERLDDVVVKRLADPPGMDELAEALHVSLSTLAHRFKAETGRTAVDHIRWLRIRAARGLLGRRGATVKSVAQAMGFSSPFYFSRVFKEVTGLTPQAYLRKQAQ